MGSAEAQRLPAPLATRLDFLETIFGGVEDGEIALWRLSDRRSRWLPVSHLEEAAEVPTSTDFYVTVAVHDRELALRIAGKTDPSLVRGSIGSAVALPGLGADVDIHGPAHKREDLPKTLEEAQALIDAFPLEPAVIVDTGNGLQVWWLFKEPWTFDGPEDHARAQRLARRFHETLQARAREHDWSLDDMSDLARVLRLPETTNTKLGGRQPVEIVAWNPDNRFEPAEFERHLVDVPRARSQGHRERFDTAAILAGVPEGQRDDSLFRFASKLRGADVPQAAAEALVLEAASNCDPPFPEREARAKVLRAYSRYAAGHQEPGRPAAESVAEEPPRPLQRLLDSPRRFPTESMGDLLGAAARAIEEITRAPGAICAQSVLGAATLGVQGFADVVLPTDSSSPLSSFYVTVALSGERKSAADKRALAPVKERELELQALHAQERLAYENDLAAWESQKRQLLNKKSSLDEKKTAVADLGPPPAPPLVPMLTCPEPTLEGLTKLFADGWPSLGLFSSEGGQFIGGHGMNNDNRLKTAAGLSGLWDGDPIKRVRSGDGPLFLPGRRLALHLLVQPGVAAELLSDPLLQDQGLLSRLLVAAPKVTAGTRFWREPSEEAEGALSRYHRWLAEVLKTPPPTASGQRNVLEPRRLPLSPLARGLWIEFADYVESRIGPAGELAPIQSLANKLPEHAARIGAVIALANDLDIAELSEDDLARGIELAKFYAQEALRLAEAGAADRELVMAENLLDWLQQFWSEEAVSLPVIYQRGPRFIRNQRTAKKMVGILEEHGWLEPVAGGGTVAGTYRRDVWRIRS